MIYTVTLSSQGQVVIPSKVRKAVGLKKGAKLHLTVKKSRLGSKLTLRPDEVSWVDRVAGTATGFYGNVDEYIKNERNSWDRP